MKVYVVVATQGDYIGYFSSDVRGVFLDKGEAEKRRAEVEAELAKCHAEVSLQEQDLRVGDLLDEGDRPCGLCDGEGLTGSNYACPACGGSGVSGT